jgi:hypothetical protein
MRRRYIQRDGELIEVPLSYVAEPRGPLVMKDIAPYKSMIDGREITSRSRHREHLRAHNCIEIGNETKYLQPKPLKSPPGLKDTIIRATDEVLRKQRR